MRISHSTSLALLFLSACGAVPMPQSKQAVPEAIVPGIARTFSSCEMNALVSHYSPAIEFVSPSTTKPLVGHAAIRTYFEGACKGSVRPIMKVDEQRVRLLGSEAAVVTGTYSFGRTDRPQEKPWPAFFVITLAKFNGQWLIETQATFPIPEP
jgi:hypothetical protein